MEATCYCRSRFSAGLINVPVARIRDVTVPRYRS